MVKTGSFISREFLILNSAEFTKQFGRPPRSKDPKAPCLVIKNQKGEDEVVWAFASPTKPWRTLTLTTEASEQRQSEFMSADSHMVADQASKYQVAALEKRTKESKESILYTQVGLNGVSSLQEYAQKLRDKYEDKPMSEPTAVQTVTSGRAGYDDEDDEECDKPMGETGEHGGADEDDDEGQAVLAGSVAVASVKGGLLQASELVTPTPKSKLARLSSTRSLPLTESPSDVQEAKSQKDDGSTCYGPGPNASDSQIVNYHIAKLNLAKALEGAKLGVARNWAIKAIAKLDEDYQAELQGHVELYDFAQNLSPEGFAKSSKEKILAALEALAPKVTSWPGKLQESVWQRAERPDQTLLITSPLSAQMDAWWTRCRPFRVHGDNEGLDIFNPMLWMLELPMEQKNLAFLKSVGGILVPLIRDSTMEEQLKKMVELLADKVSATLEVQDIGEDMYLESLMKILEVCTALQCLLTQDLFKKLDGQREVKALKVAQRTTGSTLLSRVGNAMAGSASWQEKLRQFTESDHCLGGASCTWEQGGSWGINVGKKTKHT